MKNILIGCTGSVASIKLTNLIHLINETLKSDEKIKIQVVVTESAKHFFCLNEIPDDVKVLTDSDEWSQWSKRGDPVLHIDLVKWADIFVLAPLDANTMAKLANGFCDNLLTCVARAWDFAKPILFCPAMNTKMWEHPITSEQVSVLQSWGYEMVPCISKTLMCGDTGLGAMAEVEDIVRSIKKFL